MDTKQLHEKNRGYESATTSVSRRLDLMRQGNRAPALTASVQKFDLLPNGRQARVLFQTGGDVTLSNLEEAVSRNYENRVRLCDAGGSFAHEQNRTLVTAFVELNQPLKPYTDDNLKGMKTLAANVFRDESDEIWRVKGDGDNRMLMRDTEDDLASLLDSRRSLSMLTASVEVAMSEEFAAGDAVLYYDARDERYGVGVAVDNRHVYDLDRRGAFVPVEVAQVLIVGETELAADVMMPPMSADPQKQAQGVEPLSKDNLIARHLAYMGTLYSQNGAYFEKLKALLEGTFQQKMSMGA